MTLHYCEHGGYLTPQGWPEPSGPSDYQYEDREPVVRCDQLTCGRCGRPVSIVDEPDGTTRTYGCSCNKVSVSRPESVPRSGWEDLYGPGWQCSGHPPGDLPITIEGITVSELTDLEPILRERLDAPRNNVVTAFYERLAGTPLEGPLCEIASRFLSDRNPLARTKAMGFYWRHPRAPHARRILELAQGNRRLFKGVPDTTPLARDGTIEARLILTLSKLWTEGIVSDEEALELLRREALRPDTTYAVIPALRERDTQWLRDNATKIVMSAPNAIGTLLTKGVFDDDATAIALAQRASGLSREQLEETRKHITVDISQPLRGELLAALDEANPST